MYLDLPKGHTIWNGGSTKNNIIIGIRARCTNTEATIMFPSMVNFCKGMFTSEKKNNDNPTGKLSPFMAVHFSNQTINMKSDTANGNYH